MTLPVKGPKIEEAPKCGRVRPEATANALACRVTDTAPLGRLLGTWRTELLACFDTGSASNEAPRGDQPVDRHYPPRRTRIHCRSINARRL